MPRENRYCPQEFADRLAELGGLNRYDEPMFKIVWGQTETFRAGGHWSKDGFTGYRDILVGSNAPCWMIMMWESPEESGSPGLFYYQHRDPLTGLCDLAEYPYHGRYRLKHKLIHQEVQDGAVYTEFMELNSMIIDLIMPMIRSWQRLSADKKLAALIFEQETKEDEALDAMVEAKASYAPAFGRASATVAKKVEQLERNWKQLMYLAAHTQRGFRQVS